MPAQVVSNSSTESIGTRVEATLDARRRTWPGRRQSVVPVEGATVRCPHARRQLIEEKFVKSWNHPKACIKLLKYVEGRPLPLAPTSQCIPRTAVKAFSSKGELRCLLMCVGSGRDVHSASWLVLRGDRKVI
jgi:hypothetical protein